MTSFDRGDVVLITFVFADEAGKKLRPAVVISARDYHGGRQEVIVAAVTSNLGRRLFGDQVIVDWKAAGLVFPSVATGILRTVKRSMIARKLGSLTRRDTSAVDHALRRSLGL